MAGDATWGECGDFVGLQTARKSVAKPRKMRTFADCKNMQTDYNIHTMADGLRVIHLPSASPVIYCGYAINVGSRDESGDEEGLAHLCEHMTFKGTASRKAWNILHGIENVGGDLNAFTSKEETVYHAAVLKGDAKRAIELLNDIVFHSIYPQTELEKEVCVVCEEIESYNDSPADLIYDEFENLLFKGHPLGHNILGKAEKLRSYTSDDLLRFTQKHYCADNSVFFIYGDVNFSWLIKTLERLGHNASNARMGSLSNAHERSRIALPTPCAKTETLKIDTHQAHVMVGNRAYEYANERRMTLYLLNNILAGPAMTARLNLALRERNALVYTVDGSFVSYSDTGAWSIYFGCDERNVEKCLKYIRRELDKVMQQPFTSTQMTAAKKQIKGQIGIACDNRESFAIDFAKTFLHHGTGKNIAELMRSIDAVTPQQMQQVAQEVFPREQLSMMIFK